MACCATTATTVVLATVTIQNIKIGSKIELHPWILTLKMRLTKNKYTIYFTEVSSRSPLVWIPVCCHTYTCQETLSGETVVL